MLEANCKLLKENRQITAVFKEKSIQQNYVTKISLLHLNLRCKAVVELRVAMMEKKSVPLHVWRTKTFFPSSLNNPIQLSDADMFSFFLMFSLLRQPMLGLAVV